MSNRKPIITLLGHVDHGKSSILDKIRGTAVAAREAGGITQAIGCSIVPLETVKKICGSLLDATKTDMNLPGLLFIDSPGHAAFTSLRKRGGSLADIAILVVDINDGFKPQTKESIEILKANKVPFIVAANKIDLLPGWHYDEGKFLLPSVAALSTEVQGEFEKKLYEVVGQFSELDLQAERFDRVEDYTKQVAIVPVSAHTGQGIPELLMVLTGLAQKYLEEQLKVEESGPARGTILEVTEDRGLGTTLNVIIYNGHLKVNDTIVIGSTEEPIVTKVRALLEPADLAEMREKKSKFKNVKEVFAATGVKISAPNLDKAISGMPVRSCEKGDSDKCVAEVKEEVGQVLSGEEQEIGVIIKADTIGGLEALQHLLKEKEIPISYSELGNITKRDISKLESIPDEFSRVILGFNIEIPADLQEIIVNKKLKIITNSVIYKIIEDYELFIENLRKKIEQQKLSSLVRPCKFFVMKGYIFRQSNPAIVGVEIEVGKIKTRDPIMNENGKRISSVKSLKEGQENITIAEQGKQLAMAMEGVTIGRQVNEGDFLYTDIPEEDFKQLKILKKHLSANEIAVLKEIAELKRNDNPVWGVG